MFFISEFYMLKCHPKQPIYIVDVFEDKNKNEQIIIDISSDVKFIWGNAFRVTGINLYRKDLKEISQIIREVFRDSKSMDFYKFLKEEKVNLNIPLKTVKEEFPSLYGDKLQEIISKNTTQH